MSEATEKVGTETKPGRGGARVGSGRKPGTPNKVTTEAREIFTQILKGRAKKVGGWIDKVAKDDPAKATDLLLRLAEFHIPKLARTELMNAPDSGELVFRVVRE